MSEIFFCRHILRRIRLFLWVITLAITSKLSAAHTLDETSARVILRDGQIEIIVTSDIEKLIRTLQNNQAWLMGDIDNVMTTNLPVSEQYTFIEDLLKDKVILLVNKQALNIDNVEIAGDKDEHDTHIHKNRVTLLARHSFANADEVSISFPKSLGEVHISFVKPQYKLAKRGESVKATF